MFSPEVFRTRVGLSATPTSLFMTVHPLQGVLEVRNVISMTWREAVYRGTPLQMDRFGLVTGQMMRTPKGRSYPCHVQARVTESESGAIRRRARSEGLSVNSWTRVTLLKALEVDPVTRTMIAEFLAMRRIVLTLYTELRTGGKELSAAAIDRLVADTDLRKYALADRRIRDTLGLPIEEDPAKVEHAKTLKENKK